MPIARPEEEPMVSVRLAGRNIRMMADSGATYTCVRKADAGYLPQSGQYVRIVGFSGEKNLTPISRPVPLEAWGKTIELPVLISSHTPVNLLGRDALCKLQCTILCTSDGVIVDASHCQMYQQPEEDVVYWLGDLSDSFLEPVQGWRKFLHINLPDARPPACPPHCTLQFFKKGSRP